jgi:formylmethanofuran dehydrogenase subunit B
VSESATVVEHVTCLGCGCACDDISVVTEGGRIVEARRACPLGERWFGDGIVPQAAFVRGTEVVLSAALETAAVLLASARRPLVFLAPELSCDAQREGAALADRLGALLDSVTTETARAGVLAAQRRGRASATFGEIRNRADVVVFWGVNAAERYPRFPTRYAPDPAGVHIRAGRAGRLVIVVEIGDAPGMANADVRERFASVDEVGVLGVIRARVSGHLAGDVAGDTAARAAALADRLAAGRYVAIVSDGEPTEGADPFRAEALIALAQTLNARTRCALVTLRGGGNRSGAEAVLSWQTGFPLAVDFARGVPRYRPDDAAAMLLARGEVDTTLVLGDVGALPALVTEGLSRTALVAIGPRASARSADAAVTIDTGIAGIHEAGIAFRADDVALPLRQVLRGPPEAATVIAALGTRLREGKARRSR